MKRTEKLERELIETERELYSLLVATLPKCARDGNLIFFHSQNCPDDCRLTWLPVESEALYELASLGGELRMRLCLPTTASLSELYLSACDEAADLKNKHRRGPRRLAADLLVAIQARSAEFNSEVEGPRK